MKHVSTCSVIGNVVFPEFTGERVYMRKFNKKNGLPQDLKRWQPTVDAMLDGVDATGDIFIMIDQGFVRGNTTHRREGLHIDGYWHEISNGHHGHRLTPIAGKHTGEGESSGRHRPYCKNINGHGGLHAGWENQDFSLPEDLILASNISACRALIGEYECVFKQGGDASHINTQHMTEIMLKENIAYKGNVTMLHESLPIKYDCYRTLVRLNVKAA